MKFKIVYIFIIPIFLSVGCISNNKNQTSKSKVTKDASLGKVEKIELSEKTRGTNRLITFTPNSLSVDLNGNIQSSTFSSNDWKAINTEIELLDLSRISAYKAPTTDRFTDAALASIIKIYADGDIYESTTFDSGKPPTELESLYIKLQTRSINKKGN